VQGWLWLLYFVVEGAIVDLEMIEFLLDVLQGVFEFGMVRRLVSASLIHSLVSVVPSPMASQTLASKTADFCP